MQLSQWLSVFAFGLLASAQQSPPKELEIKTTYAPSDCTVKAQRGDPIKVHYVRLLYLRVDVLCCMWANYLPPVQTGKLFSNGNKFDSRYDASASLLFSPSLNKTNIATTAANLCL